MNEAENDFKYEEKKICENEGAMMRQWKEDTLRLGLRFKMKKGRRRMSGELVIERERERERDYGVRNEREGIEKQVCKVSIEQEAWVNGTCFFILPKKLFITIFFLLMFTVRCIQVFCVPSFSY